MMHEEQLSQLNLTEDEMGRFTKAFKDENFRKMLRAYAEEISDPENRKKYEEEIALLEQDRGNSVQFIHPTPFKCVRTSVNGKLKCYVNVCANDKIGKPSCKIGVSEDGKRGHHWSLPHSLHPERKEVDPKGNKIFIYDVIFHPDTLRMASTNDRFMDMVINVALEGIQDAFSITLDKNNARTMKTKYKGSQQPCVIRKPIPGFQAKDSSEFPDPLAFPYPDNKATSSKQGPKNCQSNSEVTKQGPTKPHHTLKYRSFIDLQDFRSTRDKSHRSRPGQIVVTIDLPLLKSVAAVTLEVKEKRLLLESQDPAYKLELPLAYAVDEDQGEAKFNRQTRQLLVTLPVKPSEPRLQINGCPGEESASHFKEEDVQTDTLNDGLQNSQESNAARATNEISKEEEACVISEVSESNADISQHQEGNNQRLCEGHHNENNDQKGVIIEQKIPACEMKEVESEQKTTEGREFKTTLESKAQIRKNSKQTDDDQPEAPVCTEDPIGTTKLVIAAEEINKDHLKSEMTMKSIEKSSVPPVLLREVSKDGSQVLISNHVTTAGFSFSNSLLFELD